jgi:hypothetical protein
MSLVGKSFHGNVMTFSLNSSSNALLEAPTGTGKTLALLCGALAWQRKCKMEPVRQARTLFLPTIAPDSHRRRRSLQNPDINLEQLILSLKCIPVRCTYNR